MEGKQIFDFMNENSLKSYDSDDKILIISDANSPKYCQQVNQYNDSFVQNSMQDESTLDHLPLNIRLTPNERRTESIRRKRSNKRAKAERLKTRRPKSASKKWKADTIISKIYNNLSLRNTNMIGEISAQDADELKRMIMKKTSQLNYTLQEGSQYQQIPCSQVNKHRAISVNARRDKRRRDIKLKQKQDELVRKRQSQGMYIETQSYKVQKYLESMLGKYEKLKQQEDQMFRKEKLQALRKEKQQIKDNIISFYDTKMKQLSEQLEEQKQIQRIREQENKKLKYEEALNTKQAFEEHFKYNFSKIENEKKQFNMKLNQLKNIEEQIIERYKRS